MNVLPKTQPQKIRLIYMKDEPSRDQKNHYVLKVHTLDKGLQDPR